MSDMPLRVALRQTLQGLDQVMPKEDNIEGDTSFEHLHWMISNCLVHIMEWPTDKISRWIGFIQGVLTVRGVITTQEERDRTRPIFHKAYETMGFKKPKTIERYEDGSIKGAQNIDHLIQRD